MATIAKPVVRIQTGKLLTSLALLGAAACGGAPEPDLGAQEGETVTSAQQALITPGRAVEINYRHKTCSLAGVSAQVVPIVGAGGALVAQYTLNCEDGSRPSIAKNTFTSHRGSVTYDMSNYQFVFTGGARLNDPFIESLNETVEQVVWDDATPATASLSANRRYDRSRITFKAYDERSAYPFVNFSDQQPDDFPHVAARAIWNGDTRYVADVYIFPSTRPDANKTNWDNPLIVGDAFDPNNKRRVADIIKKPQYQKLFSTNAVDNGPRTGPHGRDLIFIDFSQGGGDLLVNAQLMLRAMEWVQSRARNEVLVGGVSMSGVLGRLALLYSMPLNNVHRADLAARVRGFISVDAPQLGASIAPRTQQVACQMANHEWLPDGEERNSAVENWRQLRSPGAREMLFGAYIRSDGGTRCGNSNTNVAIHDGFYALLNELGTTAYGSKRRGFRGDIPS
ncbi:MAG TPA: hypothetical protein VIM73_22105, partial [Polyangiaceae bacterium]